LKKIRLLCTNFFIFSVQFKLNKGEMFKIEDNSNKIKWKVLSLEKNAHFVVPSVCFVLKGPDIELVEMIEK
jgi:hypothetical protein